MYSVPQNQQLLIFVCSLGFGFLMGILYDLIRTVRLIISKGKATIIIFDVLYFILLSVLTFLFILAINKGEVRFYIIAAEFIGWIFYYVSFGIAVIKISEKAVSLFHRFLRFIRKVICAPFRLIFKGLCAFYHKITVLFKKTRKKSQKIRKKLLPKARLYVYNLFGILSVRRNHSKKGGSCNDKGKE